MNVTIVAISDTHALHRRVQIPSGDILVHAGDITTSGSLREAVAGVARKREDLNHVGNGKTVPAENNVEGDH